MPTLQVNIDPRVAAVFEAYPGYIAPKIKRLRTLILETAESIEHISTLEETLKWGEPSYLVKKGSTVRIDWKPKKPEQYAIYFKCTSLLVESFKAVFGDLFEYEGKRAIVFKLDDKIPEEALKQCIACALNYHKVKKLPVLGL